MHIVWRTVHGALARRGVPVPAVRTCSGVLTTITQRRSVSATPPPRSDDTEPLSGMEGMRRSFQQAASGAHRPQRAERAAPEAATGDHVIADFADLRSHLKRFIRRVHPDVVYSVSDEVRSQNNDSLLRLNALFDVIEDRCTACSGKQSSVRPAAGGAPALQESYEFTFHCFDADDRDAQSAADDGGAAPSPPAALRRFVHVARPPLVLDAQTRLVADKGARSPVLLAQWLDLGATTLSALVQRMHDASPGSGAATTPPPALALHPSLQAGLGSTGGAKRRQPRLFSAVKPPPLEVDLLRETLVRWSPLQQGKMAPFPTPPPLRRRPPTVRAHDLLSSAAVGDSGSRADDGDGDGLDDDTMSALLDDADAAAHAAAADDDDDVPEEALEEPSLFSRKDRVRRVGQLHRRGCFVADAASLPSGVHPHAALERLTTFLVRHYDRLLVYHDVWFTVTVYLGRVYLAVPHTRSLYVPADFAPERLDAFLRLHIDDFVRLAMDGLPKRPRAGSGARGADGAERGDGVQERYRARGAKSRPVF